MKVSDFLDALAGGTAAETDHLTCSVCGKDTKEGAVWNGEESIVMCFTCAIVRPQVLAALAADALTDSISPCGSRLGEINEFLVRFQHEFWRAITLGILVEVGDAQKKPYSLY